MELLILLAIAFAVFTAFSILLAGILTAPWVIVVGVLLLVLMGIQWLSLQSNLRPPAAPEMASDAKRRSPSPKTTSKSVQQADTVQKEGLVYRGVRYKIQPQQSAERAEISGIYRGQPWCKEPKSKVADSPTEPRQTDSPKVSKNTPELTYRGVKIRPPASDTDR
ncbi:DUF4278 domain-containing protein [Sphaerothrix gracilis]|uniref:DUF4278 domain-containing protein n=1 Tax=Sphaerothrix gracilis TaxID=3151835 RepID=UPI0031FDAB14